MKIIITLSFFLLFPLSVFSQSDGYLGGPSTSYGNPGTNNGNPGSGTGTPGTSYGNPGSQSNNHSPGIQNGNGRPGRSDGSRSNGSNNHQGKEGGRGPGNGHPRR